MTQLVQGVRPAAIAVESYALLNALRAFRHFFRHAYSIPIDFAQLQSNLEKARHLKPMLKKDLKKFLQAMHGLVCIEKKYVGCDLSWFRAIFFCTH